MPKKLNITAKIAPDVLLQEFKSEELYFFDFKISVFRKYVSYSKSNSITPNPLQIKGQKKNLLKRLTVKVQISIGSSYGASGEIRTHVPIMAN